MQIPDKGGTVMVLATIKTKGQTEKGWKIEADIPAFESNHPTMLDEGTVTDGLAALLMPGLQVSLILVRQNAKGIKGGGDREGSTKGFNYYWGLADVLDQNAAPPPEEAPPGSRPAAAAQPPAQGRTAPPGGGPGRTDATGISIERQKALDLAGRDFTNYLEAHAHDVDKVPKTFREWAVTVTQVAAAYAKFLATGEPTKGPEGAKPDPED